MNDRDDIEQDLDARPSKSQRKRDMNALQELGLKLSGLSADTLKKMPLDENLLDAILQHQKIPQREAGRRHLQLIGKLMRFADIEAVQAAYENTQTVSREASQALHELEHWRARLLHEGDKVVGDAMRVFPGVEAQPLRQMIRDAKREAQQQKPPVAARKLFQYLKQFQQHDLAQ
ncbi:MAG TPA: ribosome biogenesis factor YjgA [Pseudomonadales bacterium]|nr:ribosome biogenesis factor YjgA [Pseudomonadales bacterium]